MVFAKQLREGVRRGRIRCSVRIWKRLHVKVGGRYPMEDGHIVVDSITPIRRRDITNELARESGFDSVKDLLQIAKHGDGNEIYLIRFHYLAPGAWNAQRAPAPDSESTRRAKSAGSTRERTRLLHRIRRSTPVDSEPTD